MPLSFLPVASPDDIPALTKIHLNAFIRIPVNSAIWPLGITQAILSSTEARNRKAFAAGGRAQYFKVVDVELDEMIAFALWHVFEISEAESERTDLVPREWGPDVNLEIATNYWDGIIDSRRIMGGKPHCFLSILATAPSHHRRGAGSMLVKWGTDQADERGLPCYLESSPEGLGLYKKHGFKEIGFFDTDIGNKQDRTKMYRHIVIIRDEKLQSGNLGSSGIQSGQV